MKKIKINLLVFVIGIIFLVPTICAAAEARINDDIMLISEDNQYEEDEILANNEKMEQEEIKKDLYIFEPSDYEMDRLVDGNVFIVASGNVKISGEVNGNVYILSSGNVEITDQAYIGASLYCMSKKTEISGLIYDLYSFSRELTIKSDGLIARDIFVLTTKAELFGKIYRNINIEADDIALNDNNGNEMSIINGDFNYKSKNKIEGLENYVLSGNINFDQEVETVENSKTVLDIIKSLVIGAITSAIYVLAIYGILKIIAPLFKEKLAIQTQKNLGKVLIVGTITMLFEIIAAILIIIMLFTEFLSPIALIATTMIFIITYISTGIFNISIYEIVKNKFEVLKNNNLLKVLLLIVISMITFMLKKIPIIGIFISLAIYLLGQGLVINYYLPEKKTKTE